MCAFAAGCQSPATVHPKFAAFDVYTVGVHSVKNATVVPLDAVAFGGLFQRGLISSRTHDIPALLRASLDEGLFLKGYDTVDLGPAPGTGWIGAAGEKVPSDVEAADATDAGARPPPLTDAVLRCEILGWDQRGGVRAAFSARCSLVIARPGGEIIYSVPFTARYEESGRKSSHQSVPHAVRAAVRGALAALPEANRDRVGRDRAHR